MMAAKAPLPKALSYRNEKAAVASELISKMLLSKNDFSATLGGPMLEML